MLRTILTGAYIIHNSDCGISNKLSEAELGLGNNPSKKELEKTYKDSLSDIDIDIFHKNLFSDSNNRIDNKINDTLRGFMVSDSEYISDEDMCVCQKVDISLDGTEIAIPLYRECIKPGVTIRFSITVDSNFCDYDKEKIIKSIGCFYENYWNKVSKLFNWAPFINDKYTLFLGCV